MNTGSTVFTPSTGFTPSPGALSTGMKVQATEFKPSADPSHNPFAKSAVGGMKVGAAAFQPGMPAPPVKVEPPKEKQVLLLERIVKGTETDVKSADLTEDDSKKVGEMKDIVSSVQKDKKINVSILTNFLSSLKDVAKLPTDLIKMSVHGRVQARGDEGEERQLVEKKIVRHDGPNRGPGRRPDDRYNDRGGISRQKPGDHQHMRNRNRYNEGGDGGFRTVEKTQLEIQIEAAAQN